MRPLARASLAALAGVALAGLAAAQGDDVATFFPLQVGRVWTYHLRLTSGGETRQIEYTTRIVRQEQLDDVPGGPCWVLENHSGERLLETNWFRLEGDGRLLHPRRLTGRTTSALCARTGDAIGPAGRVLLDPAALAALPRESTWEWASKDGGLRGTVRLLERTKLRLRNFGELDCLVLLDACAATAGERTATIARRFWLAAGYGVVQELTTIEAGGQRTESEATLIRYEAP